MRSRHSVEEKFEIVMEALTENTTQAEICRRHEIFPTHSVAIEKAFKDYNEFRPYSSIDYLPPKEFRKRLLEDQ